MIHPVFCLLFSIASMRRGEGWLTRRVDLIRRLVDEYPDFCPDGATMAFLCVIWTTNYSLRWRVRYCT